ncbi:hypothetical protein DPMN_133287 [Dreissena polymorpha]|uniref:Uncharacterized protein n=1 Tax=Dreissena polymorpha TaxID=45954 RepID=A0A9D4JAU2_DREPO|nr:hypothetical protein DPMN_133287 [Dreissena polymorpha]
MDRTSRLQNACLKTRTRRSTMLWDGTLMPYQPRYIRQAYQRQTLPVSTLFPCPILSPPIAQILRYLKHVPLIAGGDVQLQSLMPPENLFCLP